MYFDFERTAETKYQRSQCYCKGKPRDFEDFINVNCFPDKHHLAFCSNNESSISSNCGNYVELLHTLAAKDDRLARHLETSTVFSGFSNIIQKDLIAAIRDVVRCDIRKISVAPFVAAEVDESTDVTNKAQISVIMWLKARWFVKEAFVGFDDVKTDEPLLHFFSCPSCLHLFMFAYFTW